MTRAPRQRSRPKAPRAIPGAEAIKRAFDAYFAPYRMSLPDDVLRRPSKGFEDNGWDVQYRFGAEGGTAYLECFTSHRMTNDRMYRVYADGRVETVGTSTDGALEDHDLAFYAEARRRGFL